MPQEMSRIAAVRAFLGQEKPVETTEMMSFWKGLTDEEKKDFSENAAAKLGVTLKVA